MSNGLVIPLGLDASGFDDTMKRAKVSVVQLEDMLKRGANTNLINPGVDASFERVIENTKHVQGTLEHANNELRAMQVLANKIDITKSMGQGELAGIINEYTHLRTTIDGASVDLSKLFELQKQYKQLTGSEYSPTGLNDNITLMRLIEQEKDVRRQAAAEAARIKAEELQREKDYQREIAILIQQEEADALAANKAKEASDAAFAAAKMAHIKEVEQVSRATRERELREAFAAEDEKKKIREQELAAFRKRQLETQQNIANETVKAPMAMPSSNITELKAKVDALKISQEMLNTTNEAGRKKFDEVGREIRKNEDAIGKLTEKQKQLKDSSSKVAKGLAAMFSLAAIKGFLVKVVEIGGELEKQKVALSAIVKSVSDANILFGQLKTQALESPFRFKEILAGTKQLSAYNIETEKLYDTQFMLSELSAGLGVEMSRLVLAYGQVRAASVLRGQEVRQFTEAGIPLLDALAEKFTKLEGKVVSTADVFDKISNRLVPFKMVDEVLRDMTEQGGKFFNMQSLQAETLAGQWNNVSDAMDLMFLEISEGNKGVLMTVIKTLRELIGSWRTIGGTILGSAFAYSLWAGYNLVMGAKVLAKQKMTNALILEDLRLTKLLRSAKIGFYAAAVIGLAAIISHLYNVSQELNRYKQKIDEINSRGMTAVGDDASRLKELTSKLKKAVEGTQEYKDIKDKIISQFGQYYSNMLTEKSTIEDIEAGYAGATDAIRAMYAEKAMQENYATLQEDKRIQKEKKNLRKTLSSDLVGFGLTEYEAKAVTERYIKIVEEALLTGEKLEDAFTILKRLSADYGKYIDKSNNDNSITNQKGHFDFQAHFLIKEMKERIKVIKSSEEEFWTSLPENIKKISEAGKAKLDEELSKVPVNLLDLERNMKVGAINSKKVIIDDLAKMLKELQSEYIRTFKKDAPVIKQEDFNSLIDMQQSGDGNLAEFINKKFLNGEIDQKSIDDKIAKFYDGVQKSFNANPRKKIADNFFSGLSEELNKELEAVNKKLWNNDAEKEAAKTKISNLSKEYLRIKEVVSGYESLSQVQKILEDRDAAKEATRQLTAEYKTIEASSVIGAAAKADAKQSLENSKETLAVWELIVKLFNLTDKPKKGKGANVEIERANKLVSIYEQLYSTYKKYNDYLGKDESATKTVAELKDEYEELNKEMGGVLPKLEAITTQQELLTKIQSATVSFKTAGGKKIIDRSAVKQSSGIDLEGAKRTFDELKLDAERILDRIVVGVDNTEFYKQLEDIIKQINADGDKGEKFLIDLGVKIDKKKLEASLQNASDNLKRAQDKFSLGKELQSLKEETSVDLTGVFAKDILNREGYLEELLVVQQKYESLGAAGALKAAETVILIEKEKFDTIKENYVAAAKIRFKLANDEEKKAILESRKLMAEEEYSTVESELKNTTDTKTIAQKEARLEYLKWYIKSLAEEVDAAEQATYRMSQMYLDLYGDAGEYGRKAYSKILKGIEDALLSAEKVERDGKDVMVATYTGDDGKSKEVVINAKDYGKALVDVKKKQREVNTTSPWSKISYELAKVARNRALDKKIKDGIATEDEKNQKRESVNFQKLGEGIGEIGQGISELSNLAGVLGLDEETQDIVDGIGGGISAIGKIASNPYDIGAWVQLASSVIKVFDAGNEAKIRAYSEAIENLGDAFEKLQKALTKSIGFDEFNRNAREMRANLEEQIKLIEMKGREELSKLVTSKKKMKEISKELKEAQDALDDFNESLKEDLAGNLNDAASNFANAWVDAYLTATDAGVAFEKSFNDMMRRILTEQLAMGKMRKLLEPLMDFLEESVSIDSEGGVELTENELKKIAILKKITEAGFEAIGDNMRSLFEILDILPESEAGDYDTLQKGIQGITESTAQVLASYVNSIRLDVVTMRMIMQRDDDPRVSVKSDVSNTSIVEVLERHHPLYIENLIAIRENTSYLEKAYDNASRGFRIS